MRVSEMDQIWKYKLPYPGENMVINMPLGAMIVYIAQGFMWCSVDKDRETMAREFTIVGTGWDFPSRTRYYRGTWIQGEYEWHLLELRHSHTATTKDIPPEPEMPQNTTVNEYEVRRPVK